MQRKLHDEVQARQAADARADDAERELLDSVKAMEVARKRFDTTSKATQDMRKRVSMHCGQYARPCM